MRRRKKEERGRWGKKYTGGNKILLANAATADQLIAVVLNSVCRGMPVWRPWMWGARLGWLRCTKKIDVEIIAAEVRRERSRLETERVDGRKTREKDGKLGKEINRRKSGAPSADRPSTQP